MVLGAAVMMRAYVGQSVRPHKAALEGGVSQALAARAAAAGAFPRAGAAVSLMRHMTL